LEWVVTTGRTIEEALETALDQLGVDEQDAEHEVLQEPQKGLFGRMRAEARVRARVRPSPPPPKVDRRERRRRDRRSGRDSERPARSRAKAGGRSGGSGSGSGSPAGARGGSGSGSGSGSRSGSGENVRVEARVAADRNGSELGGGSPDGDGGSASSQGGGQRRRRRRRSRGSGKAEGADVVSESTTTTEAAETATLDIEAQRAAVEEFLRGLLESFGRSDAKVAVAAVDGETLDAAIDGSELGLLVGQKGVTLQSLQELVRSMVQRRFVGQAHARVRVDVAGYRERRRAALERFTADVAAGVRETGVAKALDPMGPADRKVVHDAVNEIEGVETVSEGQDADRHVVIRPISS
jgi:spoIIIJ-associated protein